MVSASSNSSASAIGLSDLRVLYPQGSIAQTANLNKGVVAVVAKEHLFGQYTLTSLDQRSILLKQEVRPGALTTNLIVASLIKSLLGQLRLEPLKCDMQVTVKADAEFEGAYNAFGFKRSNDEYSLNLNCVDAALLRETKLKLLQQTENKQKVGRGYIVDSQVAPSRGLELLMQEYNEVAWGFGGWARHASVAADELELIAKLGDSEASIVEIGAGAGRITRVLAENFKSVTATDYSQQVVETLNDNLLLEKKFKNVTVVNDDIVNSRIPANKFDKVLFLENGLGGILSLKDRKHAIQNMIRILKPGGELVLGIRSMGASGDHLMPATQNSIFMGIYRTFSPEEIHNLVSSGVEKVEVIRGSERPAGGHQLFFVFRKKK